MKHAANLISLSRIVFSVGLIFSFNQALLFTTLYLACGLSDFLDGYVARKTNTQSELGARLDSIADFIFFTVITVYILIQIGTRSTPFIPWIFLIALLRGVNIMIAAYKFRSFAILHTWGNKITGFLVFITPLFLVLQQQAIPWVTCVAALLSVLEESTIHLTSSELDINRRSILR